VFGTEPVIPSPLISDTANVRPLLFFMSIDGHGESISLWIEVSPYPPTQMPVWAFKVHVSPWRYRRDFKNFNLFLGPDHFGKGDQLRRSFLLFFLPFPSNLNEGVCDSR